MKRKLTALLCLVLSVFLLMPGCAKKTDPGQDPGTDPGETPSQEEPKKEETSKDPISIETEAGAVLVGIVRKDADGWYLQTEQPVNVTLTALLDRPEVFDNQTGIRMFETDAYSLGNFRDCTVTVQGMLQNYRGAGTLYLYPCLIEVGKTVDVGRAMPELTYPEATISGDYDPSIPLPEKMQPVIRNGKYVYNFYSLSRNTLEQMGNDYTAFYISEVQRRYSEALRFGDSGLAVRTVRFYLAFLGYFLPELPPIRLTDQFDQEMLDAVYAFQSYAGLTADGVVGRDTWNAIQQAYEDVLEDLPEDYQQFAREIYPGRFIVLGDRGDTVLLLQQQLNRIAAQDPDIPTVAEDGIFGRGTQAAVLALQRKLGIDPTGAVGPVLWAKIVTQGAGY